MKFLKEIHEEYGDDSIDLMEALNQSVKQLHLLKNGGRINNKAVKDFIRKNPTLTDAATINALASYQQYKTNKRSVVSLFAKSAYDKKMVKKIVDSMTKSGQFKLHRSKYANGGKYYELKQVKAGF